MIWRDGITGNLAFVLPIIGVIGEAIGVGEILPIIIIGGEIIYYNELPNHEDSLAPYSPESVDKRRSNLRDELGTGNLDPDSPVPDQSPGRNMGGHSSRGRTPHQTGERNVNSKEEHSRRKKGKPSGLPRC